MSTPLRTITLTGTCLRGAGPEPATGYVQIAAANTTEAPGADVIVTTQPGEPTQLDSEGRFALPVVVADDPGLARELYVEVRFLLAGCQPESRTYRVTTLGDTLDLADATVLDVVPAPRRFSVLWDQVGVPGGVAALDASGKVPADQLPAGGGGGGGSVASVNNQLPDVNGNVTVTAAIVGALTQAAGDARYVQPAALGSYATDAELAAGLAGKAATVHTHGQGDITGLAGALAAKADLVDGKLPAAQLPSLAIVDNLGAVSSQAAMLALTGQRGDWATRTDLGTNWQIIGDDPTQLASWMEHTYPASPVSSVAGRTGAVVLTKTDVGLNQVDNTSDANKPVSIATAAALASKSDVGHTHDIDHVTGLQGELDALGAAIDAVDSAVDEKEPIGTAAGLLTVHEAAANPHSQYLTGSEGDAAYAAIGHTHPYVSQTLVDAKGDLIAGSAADTVVRVPVGSDGQVLTASSAASSGVAWAAPASGGEQEVYGPLGSGFQEWTCDPVVCNTTYPTNNGVLILVRHRFRKAVSLAEIGFVVTQAGVTPGAFSGVAVYADGTGTVARQGQSADQGTAFTTTGAKSLPLSAAVDIAAGEFRWIGYLWQGASQPRIASPFGTSDTPMMQVGRRRSVFFNGQTGFPASLDVAAGFANTTTYWFSFK